MNSPQKLACFAYELNYSDYENVFLMCVLNSITQKLESNHFLSNGEEKMQ